MTPHAYWSHLHLTIPVHILSTRACYGRVDVLVRPVGGTGERWVSEGMVRGVADGFDAWCADNGQPITQLIDGEEVVR